MYVMSYQVRCSRRTLSSITNQIVRLLVSNFCFTNWLKYNLGCVDNYGRVIGLYVYKIHTCIHATLRSRKHNIYVYQIQKLIFYSKMYKVYIYLYYWNKSFKTQRHKKTKKLRSNPTPA